MKVELSFPDTKISEAFLEFAQPLFPNEHGCPTPEELESALKMASTIWNAVVFDTVHGNTEWVTRVRKQVAGSPPVEALIEEMILRKKTLFGHDLRLVGEFKLIERNGDWSLRVEARVPGSA